MNRVNDHYNILFIIRDTAHYLVSFDVISTDNTLIKMDILKIFNNYGKEFEVASSVNIYNNYFSVIYKK